MYTLEDYCEALETDLNKKCKEIHQLEDKIKSLEKLINNTFEKLDEYYQQQQENIYFSHAGKRLICQVIENCKKIVVGTFEI